MCCEVLRDLMCQLSQAVPRGASLDVLDVVDIDALNLRARQVVRLRERADRHSILAPAEVHLGVLRGVVHDHRQDRFKPGRGARSRQARDRGDLAGRRVMRELKPDGGLDECHELRDVAASGDQLALQERPGDGAGARSARRRRERHLQCAIAGGGAEHPRKLRDHPGESSPAGRLAQPVQADGR
jgi:hypothetical protein